MKNIILIILSVISMSQLSFAQLNSSSFRSLGSVSRNTEGSVSRYAFDMESGYSSLADKKQKVSLPTPEGDFADYIIEPTQVVHESVAQFYTIKTYRGYALDNPNTVIALDATRNSIHVAVQSPNNGYVIEQENNDYRSNEVVVRGFVGEIDPTDCELHHNDVIEREALSHKTASYRSGNTKMRYKVAITAAGEYSEKFGGTPYSKTNVLNSLASGLNISNTIFNRDLQIDLVLVSTPDLVYDDKNTDPFDPNIKATYLDSNTDIINNAIGEENYDIGHVVMWIGRGGVAYKSGVCTNLKGGGFSSTTLSFEVLWTYYFCHEVGHQLGADHTFSSETCRNSVNKRRVEPGSGTSIMSYVNLCNTGTITKTITPDMYFHPMSMEQIEWTRNYKTCGEEIEVDNSSPVIDAGENIVIPTGTPFVLVGEGIDDSETKLTYNWSQNDRFGSATTSTPDCSDPLAALFRYRNPTENNYREFPVHKAVLRNVSPAWETLPCVSREMNFEFVVRDNEEVDPMASRTGMKVDVMETGPFDITKEATGELMSGGTFDVEWSVNGTDAHTPTVDILMSFDNGLNYSIVVSNIANDGLETIVVPAQLTTEGRIAVRAHVDKVSEGSDQLRAASTFYTVTKEAITIVEGDQVAFPVDLVKFEGEAIKTGISLSWETATEINNKEFVVEKLIGSEWVFVGSVLGNGTTTSVNNYEYLDTDVVAENTYRLVSIDLDGTEHRSEVITIAGNRGEGLSIFTNPTTQAIEIKNVKTKTLVNIFDMQGRNISSQYVEGDTSIETAGYDQGMYIVNYDTGIENNSIKIVLK